MNGTVKWFDHTKGYGFINSPEAPGDIFVHARQVTGGAKLNEGDQVTFELKNVPGKGDQAQDVSVV